MGGQVHLRAALRTALREPLVQLLIAGSLIFLLSMWRGAAADPESRNITISRAQVERLAATWEMTWRRPPLPSEIDALIRDYIKEEIYYREARRLGLDENDAVIRRRLRSKMEYLAKAQVENAVVGDATLQAWLDTYPGRFARDSIYSFDQIYLGDGEQDIAQSSLDRLAVNAADWTDMGKPISLPLSLEHAQRSDVERQFGTAFAGSLASVPPEKWTGPIKSGFGIHLVRVRRVEASVKPQLRQVRQAVENDWRQATSKQREAKAYQALLDGYSIRIANP